jgi:hypothetical protein
MPKLDRDPEALAYHEPDRRADGGTRTVRLSRRGVRIERALSGVKMRLAVPIEAYRGVVLAREDRLERGFYRLTLDHADADLSVTLSRAIDISALVDLWSDWARFFAKPALLDEKIGIEPEAPTLRKLHRQARAKRRIRIRPRNRAARLPGAAKIFSAERELFSRE